MVNDNVRQQMARMAAAASWGRSKEPDIFSDIRLTGILELVYMYLDKDFLINMIKIINDLKNQKFLDQEKSTFTSMS